MKQKTIHFLFPLFFVLISRTPTPLPHFSPRVCRLTVFCRSFLVFSCTWSTTTVSRSPVRLHLQVRGRVVPAFECVRVEVRRSREKTRKTRKYFERLCMRARRKPTYAYLFFEKVEKGGKKSSNKKHKVSISSTFFARVFRTNVILAAFSGYILALANNSYKKCVRKTLMKLTICQVSKVRLFETLFCLHNLGNQSLKWLILFC